MVRLWLKLLLLAAAGATYALTVFVPSAAQAAAVFGATNSIVISRHLAATPPQAATAAAAPAGDDLSVIPPQVATAADTEAAAPAANDVSTTPPQVATAADTDAAAPATEDLSVATVIATPGESHLPAWVQVNVASGPLYAADSSSDQVLTKLPRNIFLRVITGGASRLQVQAYDQNGAPTRTGWVSADQVLPSAPGADWLVAASATTLWSSPDSSATSVRNLGQFTPLVKLDGPQLNRLHVRVYRSDFSGVVGDGWIDVLATGPALPPQVRTPAPSDPSLTTRAAGTAQQQTAFMEAAAQAARQSATLTGVPASVTVAQAILESDWGRSTLAQGANNYFGMKVLGTLGNDGVVWMPTSEYDESGNLYSTTSAFRAYKTLADSMADHDRLLSNLSRYAGAMQVVKDPKSFASRIAQEGYSTDPSYADKLIALMDRYNLYSLDA